MNKSVRVGGNFSGYGLYERQGFFNPARNLNIPQYNNSPLNHQSPSFRYKNEPTFKQHTPDVSSSMISPIQRKPSPDQMGVDEKIINGFDSISFGPNEPQN
jgi:hypothetical protein